MKTALYFIPVLVVFVILLILAEFFTRRRQIYYLKPISTLILIVIASLSFLEPTRNLVYSLGVLVGLFFSAGGDLALMFQEKRKAFMVGLVLFLLAHIAYAVVLSLLGSFSYLDIFLTAALMVLGVLFYGLARSNLGKMKVPVILYIVVISVMVERALAATVSHEFSPNQALMIAFGAVLFYISDLILAANRFWKPWKYHRVSLAFYYCGQMLIALAASYFG